MTTPATYHIPDDRYYDRDHHLWIQKDSTTNRGVVGLDTLGLAALGDLAYISLQAVGMSIKRGESMGMLEAAKMTNDLVAPASGILVDRNEAVLRNPQLVNSDPYGQGWLVTIELTDWENESASLVSGEMLPGWVATEIERYRSQGWID